MSDIQGATNMAMAFAAVVNRYRRERHETLPAGWAEITNWAASYGYLIQVCPTPHGRPDALGVRAASPHAQLCAERVIAVASEPCVDHLFSIAHEMAHGERPGESEELVHAEAAAMLAKLAAWALIGGGR